MKEIFISLISIGSIVLIIRYLIQISIWTRFIQPMVQRKAKLVITFEDGTDVMTIPKAKQYDVQKEVNELITAEHIRIPYVEMIDPFLDMFGATRNNTSNNRIYNSLLEDYFECKQVEYANLVQSKVEEQYMKPVKLVIHNRGKVPCGKSDIDIRIIEKENLYLEDARKMITAYSPKEPIQCPDGIFPCLDSGRQDYFYTQWNMSEIAPRLMHFKLDVLNQGRKDGNLIMPLYVDTRIEGQIHIDWVIVEPSYSEPLTGELIINIR
ncbi:MAG: hypothetical protein Q4E68_02920 [Prevotellaceae bacterium]|nr:hypothetical protein [Prevotellaceae bacterium]